MKYCLEKLKNLFKKSPECVFVVTMYRFGDKEYPSYVHGIFKTKENAIKSAIEEKEWRGNTYYPEVLKFNFETFLNSSYDKEVVMSIEDFEKKNILK